MKKIMSVLMILAMMLSGCISDSEQVRDKKDTGETIQENIESVSEPEGVILDPVGLDAYINSLSLETLIGQMIQGELQGLGNGHVTEYKLGSVLSGGGSVPARNNIDGWNALNERLQNEALATESQIPILYGIDSVHGHANVNGAVIYPHNIGIGAANNVELTKAMGYAIGNEMKLTKTIWNFSPCVAISADPRWGRTYESYSSDEMIVSSLALAYFEGLRDAGIIATAKHYVGDGAVEYGTGVDGLLDRGNTIMDEDLLFEVQLEPYRQLVEAGVPVVMTSFSQFNGVHMHEHQYLIETVLKGEMGFEGFVVSDWEAIQLMPYATLKEQVIASINAGVDMLMQPYNYDMIYEAMLQAVNEGSIEMSRVKDAVTRIMKVKLEAGIIEDPYLLHLETEVDELGSDEYRAIAKQLVSESLVLLKNEDVLPLKSGQTVFVYGSTLDDIGVQCGGWSHSWQGQLDPSGSVFLGKTIVDGIEELAEVYDITIITDPEKMNEADVMIAGLGEIPYAEMMGDTTDLSLLGIHGLDDNLDVLEKIDAFNGSVVTLIVAGRHVDIGDYINDWDSAVMCYLPGTEGDGVAPVLFGEKDFVGKLPMHWYADLEGVLDGSATILYEMGHGQ